MTLTTKQSRLVWFNSVLETLSLSDDHLDYLQQLINVAVAPINKTESNITPEYTTFIQQHSAIPELVVSLAKGDYINIFLHDSMYELLDIVNTTVNESIQKIVDDPRCALQINLINILSQRLFEWLESSGNNNTDDANDDTDAVHQLYDEKQVLLIILAIAAMNLFSQVNYAGVPMVLPYNAQQFKTLVTSSIKTNSTDEQTTTTTTTVARNVLMFFQLFSPKFDHEDIERLANGNSSDTSLFRHIDVNKTMLCNASLKLNGEDTYQCSYYPLLLIITRSIFNVEDLLTLVYFNEESTRGIQYTSSLTSVISLFITKYLSSSSSQQQQKKQQQQKQYLFLPAVLHFILRAMKIHNDISLSNTSVIRIEFYTMTILYQICYNILNNNQNNNLLYQEAEDNNTNNTSALIEANNKMSIIKTICSEFTCHKMEKFHIIYNEKEQEQNKNQNSNTFLFFTNILDALYYLQRYLQKINFNTIVQHIISENDVQVNINSSMSKQKDSQNITGNNVVYNSLLLYTYNSISNYSSSSSSTTTTTTTTTTTNNINNNNDVQKQLELYNNITENTVEDVHAVGLSPLSHKHIHATYRPVLLYNPYQMIVKNENNNNNENKNDDEIIDLIPTLLPTTIYTTITIELSYLALKLYQYKRCFLLLSLSKLFSGVCIHISGVMGRRTKYQSRSHAQLSGTSFIHKDFIQLIKNVQLLQEQTQLYEMSNLLNQTNMLKYIKHYEIVSNTVHDGLISPYIIPNKGINDLTNIKPEVIEDLAIKQEKETYKGVINQRNPTIPRLSIISEGNNNNGEKKQEEKEQHIVCVTNAGHVEDQPIDGIDDVYMTYMLLDTDNYVVDPNTGRNIDPEQQSDDDEKEMIVAPDNNLDGVVDLLASFGKKGGGIIFQSATQREDDDEAQDKINPIPPLHLFSPHYQTTMSSLLILNVVNYLYNTQANQSEIAQNEQDCYLRTILTHKYYQTTTYANEKVRNNNIEDFYSSYNNIKQYNMVSIPFTTMLTTLLYRSILESTQQRMQVRAISQIELLSNIYLGSEQKLRQIHFQPTHLPELVQLYHNVGINNSIYDLSTKKVSNLDSIFNFYFEQIKDPKKRNLPHHTFAQVYPEEYNYIIQQTIRHLIRFRMNKLYTANTQPWWEVLRTCGDVCAKQGYTSTALKCYVNVQLWATVIDTLITIGRRGDATKLLKRVLNIKTDKEQERIEDKTTTTTTTTTSAVALTDTAIIEEPEDYNENDDDNIDTSKYENKIINIKKQNDNDGDDDDIDTKDGSLLTFITKSMRSSLYTTTTISGTQHLGLSLSSYRLYHLLGESTQEPQYWLKSWELSDSTYAPPQRALAKWYAVRKQDEKAYECYQNALKLNNTDHQTWYECGVVAIRLQQYEKAIPCFTNALRIKPDISEGWNNLAACHLYLNNISSAYHALSQCLRTKRSSWKIWENYLQCALQLEFYSDVVSTVTKIAELKGKVDPLTLLPIQYTTQQSKLHVYALFITWYQHILKDINKMKQQIIKITKQHKLLKSAISNNNDNDNKTNDSNNDDCTLCIEYTPDFDVGLMPITQTNMVQVLFPFILSFRTAAQSIIQNIFHNESREKDGGGKMRGGGEDGGLGNSVIAQLEQHQHQKKLNSTTDDDNADNIVNDSDDSDDSDSDDDDDNNINKKQKQKNKEDQMLMQQLSSTAKGQRIILNFLIAQSYSTIAIDERIDILLESNRYYEECINILIKLAIENAPISNPNNQYIMEFTLSVIGHAVNNAEMIDHHIIYHLMGIKTDGTTNTNVEVTKEEKDNLMTQINNRYMVKLIVERLLDGWQREHDMIKKDLKHIEPYIIKLKDIIQLLKDTIDNDEQIIKKASAAATDSNTTTASKDPYDSFGGYGDYDPYGSYY